MNQSEMGASGDRVETFKKRIGFSTLASMDGPDGVRANWDDLLKVLAPIVKGKRIDSGNIVALAPGLARTNLIWKEGADHLSIWLFVSGTGPVRAQEKLLSIAADTMRVRIPYLPGPPGLGDLAIRHASAPSDTVIWVYRNVCVEVDNVQSGVDVEPIARAIQHFMAAHRVSRLADHLPVVERIDVSPKQLHAGQEVRVSIVLPKITPAESLVTDFIEVGDPKLEILSFQPLTVVYKATLPGQARVDIPIADRKTMLSPPLAITIDILPGG